jgi:Xaa-Pro aminopeptidase
MTPTNWRVCKMLSFHFARLVATSAGFASLVAIAAPEAQASGWIERAIQSQKAPEQPKAAAKPPAQPAKVAAAAAPVATPKQAGEAMARAANDAGSTFGSCGTSSPQLTLNECIATRLDKLANDLEKTPGVKLTAAKTILEVREAAKSVRAAKTKEEIAAVLQKAAGALNIAIASTKQTTISGFGPKTGIEGVAGALNKAIAAVQKGA